MNITSEAMGTAASIEKNIPSRITGDNRVFIRAVIARAITDAVAAEREACALLVDAEANEHAGSDRWMADDIVSAIRARCNHDPEMDMRRRRQLAASLGGGSPRGRAAG